MQLFLVREAGTTKVHGIFWAETPAALWDAVDEMADPSRFEWAEIADFGGVWREEELDEALPVPDRADFPPGDDGDGAFGDAYSKALSFGVSGWGENLLQMISNQGEHEWTRFDFADKGDGMIARVWAKRPG